MDKTQTMHSLAENLMKILPNMGRQIAGVLRASGEEETTLMQVGTLHQIKDRSMTASDIAKKRRVSLQSVSVFIQAMVEKGWVVRVPNPEDRRQFLLQITPDGMQKAEATREQIINYLADFLAELSPEEIAAGQVFLPAINRLLNSQSPVHEMPSEEKQNTLEEEAAPL